MLPERNAVLTGMASRVPTVDVPVVALTCELETATAYEEIKAEVKAEALIWVPLLKEEPMMLKQKMR